MDGPNEKPKSNRGGRRPGAGRKKSEIRCQRDRVNAAMDKVVLPQFEAIFESLVRSALGTPTEPPDSRAAIYLVDRYLGRPRQSVEVKDATRRPDAGADVQEKARRELSEWATQDLTGGGASST